jgi:hypothetical protein
MSEERHMILVDNFNVPTLVVYRTTQLADLEVMMFINADYSLVFLGVIPKFYSTQNGRKITPLFRNIHEEHDTVTPFIGTKCNNARSN